MSIPSNVENLTNFFHPNTTTWKKRELSSLSKKVIQNGDRRRTLGDLQKAG
jgi:hypothetical protein